jgi:rare lipoprotein A
MLRASRPIQLCAGAFMLAIPASAVALTAGQADTPSAIHINTDHRHVAFGHKLTVTGTVTPSKPGQPLQLEYAPAGRTDWQPVAATKVRGDGRFRFVSPLRKSGLVRVVAAGGSPSPRVTQQTAPTTQTTTTSTGGAPQAAPSSQSLPSVSPSQRVTVGAQFIVPNRTVEVLGGNAVHVRGTLLARVGRRRVMLDGGTGHGWHTLASTRTGPHGGFDLRYPAGGTGQEWLRVRFSGDRLNSPSAAGAGRLSSFRQSLASWYDDGGATACGFHAQYGVANKSLPCGTQVTFHYGGRSVTATVDDRGPYVGGREWDLNQNVAGALGFGGVDTVWSST